MRLRSETETEPQQVIARAIRRGELPRGDPRSKPIVAEAFPDAADGNRIPGHRHTAAYSKFNRGSGVAVDQSTVDVRREIGANGMFIEYTNGYSAGIPNGNAESYALGPYSTDSAVHSQHVLQYFLGAGLPADQVAGTAINTWMRKFTTMT